MALNRVKDSCHGSFVPSVADKACARRRKKWSSGYVGAHIVNLAQSFCSDLPFLTGWRTAMLFLRGKTVCHPAIAGIWRTPFGSRTNTRGLRQAKLYLRILFFCGCGGQMYAVDAQFMLTVGERRRTATVSFSALCVCGDTDSSFCQRVAR